MRRVDRHGEALILCRKCSAYFRCRLGAKQIPMQARKDGHETVWEDVKTNPQTRRRKGARQRCEMIDNRKAKRRVTRELREEFEVGGFS